ncbi:bifunctional aminoglycoside phosphotransferase/ATP-binding protein [Halomonas sp. YLGW01]|uniref:bifunctional aminoglycoside phosphotransferase/ATP-binding protein n=1 Tax=Halomonas sp. YLGW01 TaxID=2773308 RepID=UPI00178751C4|nr:bifunctional aminoglycoside phosphotransferase/ATP-binding protein [Halomonas sp. YLGW01]
MSDVLIQALREAACYDHPVGEIELHETHISWILLTGDYAYKIKKPVDFGSFLDFSTLEKRRGLCEQEVRLNRRLAPSLYLDVVPISGSPEAPRLNDDSAPFEYAVKMRQFSNRHLFSSLQADGELSLELLDDLVDQLVDFHEQAARVEATSHHGSADSTRGIVAREFSLIGERLPGSQDRERLEELQERVGEMEARLTPVFAERHREGFVRETHGDIHLGNAVRHQGRALLFDGIEFNDALRWNDIGCDLAFLLMDLEARGELMLARHALNRYLELSGDYALVRVLDYYKIYRALVRAKVAMLRHAEPGLPADERTSLWSEYQRYLALAEGYSEFRFPYLLIGVGVSGSGKSRFTGEMVRRLGGVRLRSDVERKRLYGFAPQADSRQGGVDIYTPEATERTYQHLARLCGLLFEAGLSVCVDATCLKRSQRDLLADQAEARGLAVMIISFEADAATLRARIEKRARLGGDPSEASLAVLERQLAHFEPFSDEERRHLVHLDTTADNASETLAELIHQHMNHA